MRLIRIFAVGLVGLTAACNELPAPDPWSSIDPRPVRDWCQPGEAPEPRGLWYSCSGVTREDGERLGVQSDLVDRFRGGGR